MLWLLPLNGTVFSVSKEGPRVPSLQLMFSQYLRRTAKSRHSRGLVADFRTTCRNRKLTGCDNSPGGDTSLPANLRVWCSPFILCRWAFSWAHCLCFFVTKTSMNNSFSIWQLRWLRHRLVNERLGRIFFFFALARFGSPLESCLFVKECYNGEALKNSLAHMMTRLCSDQTTRARRQITQQCLLIMREMSANQMAGAQIANHLQVFKETQAPSTFK